MKLTGRVFGNQANRITADLMLNLIISGKDSSKKFLFYRLPKMEVLNRKIFFL